MGFDLYGHKPRHPDGEYFRASIWSWPAIHMLIAETQVLDEDALMSIAFNDGHLITEIEAVRISDGIAKIIAEDAEDAEYAEIQETPLVQLANKLVESLEQTGATVSASTGSFVNKEYIEEFIRFSRNSGGFNVY
jgi:hypothetical protein